MANFYPYLSENSLLATLGQVRTDRHAPGGPWPHWLQGDPADLLARQRFIVCGSQCRAELRLLARHAEVVAIVDDVLLAQGHRHLFGTQVISSEAWVEKARNDQGVVSVVLTAGPVGFQHFSKLAAQWELPTLYPSQYLDLLDAAGISTGGAAGRFFWYGKAFRDHTEEHLDQLIAARTHFGDAWSRQTWLCILLYRMTLNPFFLTACAVGHNADSFGLNSYEINRQFLQFSDREVYVDGGTFDGDSLGWFVRAVDGKFKHIHTFEPSAENNQTIRRRLSTLQQDYLQPLAPRVTLHEKGLWNTDTTLLFNPCVTEDMMDAVGVANPPSAHLVEGGVLGHMYNHAQEASVSTQVPVTTIDGATDGDATFIKLEIEGSELQALQGARETIARNRPMMSIAMYHKPEDLETLLDFVLASGQGYKLGFRQHNPLCPDAMVMYCW